MPISAYRLDQLTPLLFDPTVDYKWTPLNVTFLPAVIPRSIFSDDLPTYLLPIESDRCIMAWAEIYAAPVEVNFNLPFLAVPLRSVLACCRGVY